MSSLVLSREEEHVVRLDIRVEDSEWQGQYDRLEVYRSVLGAAGPYEELTGAAWSRARLPSGATEDPGNSSGPLVPVGGKELVLLLNGSHLVEVIFTGTVTHAEAALEIEEYGRPLLYAYVDQRNRLAMQTQALGGVASIQVVSGDAAPILGLEIGAIGYGADPRPVLIPNQKRYRVTDYYGKSTYYYRTRFYNTSTGASSEMSPAFSAKGFVSVDPSNIVRGFVRLIRRDGRPNAKQQLTVYTPVLGQRVDGATVTSETDAVLTDDNGYAEVTLLRGTTVDVNITGTNLMRRVVVPTDPTLEIFDLLDPAYGTDDAFAVQRPETVPFAERNTL